MNRQTTLSKILSFFLIKMIVGIGVIVSLVALIEWIRSSILDKTNLSNDFIALIVAVTEDQLQQQITILL